MAAGITKIREKHWSMKINYLTSKQFLDGFKMKWVRYVLNSDDDSQQAKDKNY